jgi:hypothetical protein
MPWTETDSMTERLQCMAAYLNHLDSMPERCERVGIRRHPGDTWVRRSPAEGWAGLQEQSRAPHRGPHRLPEAVEAVLVAAKHAPLLWGPRTILPARAPRHPALPLPAPSPVGELFPRAG